jgi:hypothetical protein
MGKLRATKAKPPSPELVTLSDGEGEAEDGSKPTTTVRDSVGTLEGMTKSLPPAISTEQQEAGDEIKSASVTREEAETPKDGNNPLPDTHVAVLEEMDFEPPPGRPQASLRRTPTPKLSEASMASPASPVFTAEEAAQVTEQLGEVELEVRRHKKRGRYYRYRTRRGRQQRQAKEMDWHNGQGGWMYPQQQYDHTAHPPNTAYPQWYPSTAQDRWPHTSTAFTEPMPVQQPYVMSGSQQGWSTESYSTYPTHTSVCTNMSYSCPCYRCEMWRTQ